MNQNRLPADGGVSVGAEVVGSSVDRCQTKQASSSSLLVSEVVTTSLVQDDVGFPLAIFTKV